ncbi:MAG: queuosine precursor transporter [Marinilabiliales bacterium]|nr:queuosine precursor transporter [Marinilabiliales bacterium]
MKKNVSVLFMLAGILFAVNLLIANILAVKIISVGTWAAPAGILIFPIAYILNDIIVEVWGYQKARLIIWTGFAANLLAALFFSLAVVWPAASFWQNQSAFATIIGNTPRIVVASLLAYLVGSFLNAIVMSRIKVMMKGKEFSVRAILSTLVGESADSLVFITIAFAGSVPWKILAGMVLTQAILKTLYEIVILPLTIIVVKWVKRVEGVDVIDHNISYNPFLLHKI